MNTPDRYLFLGFAEPRKEKGELLDDNTLPCCARGHISGDAAVRHARSLVPKEQWKLMTFSYGWKEDYSPAPKEDE